MRIAVMQTHPVKDGREAALDQLDSAVVHAAEQGADILVTPEMYLTGYNIGQAEVQRVAEPSDGPMLAQVSAIAKRHAIAIVVGFPERAEDGTIYNSVAFLNPQGQLQTCYRKTHLYGDVDRTQFSAGDRLCQPFEFKGWQLGLAICYDIEFPEVSRALAASGAELVLTPTANMAPYDSVATRLVPARAQENTVYVVYANYVGNEAPFDYCGLSCICAPDGEDIVRAGRSSEVIFGDISKQDLKDIRQSATHLTDVRTGLYDIN